MLKNKFVVEVALLTRRTFSDEHWEQNLLSALPPHTHRSSHVVYEYVYEWCIMFAEDTKQKTQIRLMHQKITFLKVGGANGRP